MLTAQSLTKTFNQKSKPVVAVDRLDLDVAAGELLVLLGPSGCGKTTALRCLAGLESADEGSIRFGPRVVFDAARGIDIPPERRQLGMVFQSYALWPHKTVRENIAYPLRARRLKSEYKSGQRVAEAAALVDCGELLDRYPAQLSGGQQQRVSLARGLVARPDVMLFDEPLSNLDALLRGQVRNELHELHAAVGFTGVYVTHDQAEAFALGDRLAVMRSGRIEQIGTPYEIYASPTSEYTANFVGSRNRLVLERDGDGWRASWSGDRVAVPELAGSTSTVRLRFRPTDIELVADTEGDGGVCFDTVVVDSVYCGGHHEVTLTAGEDRITMFTGSLAGDWSQGARRRVRVPWSRCGWFDEQGRRLETFWAAAHEVVTAGCRQLEGLR